MIGNSLKLFENFTFIVPSNFTGSAAFQAQHNFLVTPPVSWFLQTFEFGYTDSSPT
jgi:hypothetical protein